MRFLLKKHLLILIPILTPLLMQAQQRSQVSFNRDWRFKLDSVSSYATIIATNTGWRTLSLPHDWSIEGTFSKTNPAGAGGGALPGGTGWYTKQFQVPVTSKGKQVSILFDGVYCNSEVWINNKYLGKRPNGYISFSYDISPYLQYGTATNTIVVKVDNSKQPNSRWYSGSGIYRNVWLLTTNNIHVAKYGSFISTPQVNAQSATVNIKTTIANDNTQAATAVLETTIISPAGKIAGKAKNTTLPITENMTATASQQLSISSPELWSVESPTLYTAVTKVFVNGKQTDEYKTSFGIRSFSFDPYKGFFLNGKPLKILGVCNHHDLGSLGTAINTRALERQLEMLKEMGCNGIRTSHNPPTPELLELCDKMGFIVMDEFLDMWARAKTPYDYHLDFPQWHRTDLEEQVKRDRNHPSVFIWSVGNEIYEQWTSDGTDTTRKDTTGRTLARELVSIVQNLDTSRPVVTANNEPGTHNNLIKSGAFDMIGINYHHDFWPGFHKSYPGKKLIITESVSALETRGHYDLVPADSIRRWPEAWDKPFVNGNADLTVSAYDHVSTPWGSTHEETWRILKNNDHISGMYIWTGWDYLGEPTPYDWPAHSSYFGIIDLAGFPKDVFYMYKSEWTNTPVLHLLPHWNWQQGNTVDVVAYYNNADEVELFLNGKSLGAKTKSADTFHVTWHVPFEAGTIKAVSRKNGKTVLTKEIKTAGAPAKIVLEADRSRIKADGTDLSFITVKVVDEKGIVVPDADQLVHFSVNGNGFIAGVDNGCQTSLESFKASQRSVFHGLALAIIQSNGKPGAITLTATAPGLTPATIIISAK